MALVQNQYDVIVVTVIYFDVIGIGAWQAVSFILRQFSMTLQTKILSTETSDFSNKIFLKSFKSVLLNVYILLFVLIPQQLSVLRVKNHIVFIIQQVLS